MVGQIDKAKSICECLIASEGADLKLEEAFCLFFMGQANFFGGDKRTLLSKKSKVAPQKLPIISQRPISTAFVSE
ncbi:plastid division protein CDP1 [Pyrus ussuriensis x Pyrus communis]|uniref:Plastid division protein CDP1 n=1 Tax=Pyrus ussuriensis x Pyrus communis TaxID=2448454 RepID=A0A5N5EZ55_9ROSA|nr:plastid division protein CDP1 [Pyrus ussuriensis x Pyrus communis]